MGKNATPKVAMDAKNHMENHVTLSVSVVPCMVVSVCASFFLKPMLDKTDSQTL
jgi:hypothetical protein